jgi:hypothetical protein
VQVPDTNLLLQKREKLAHKQKEAEQTSVFKRVYRKLFGYRPDSSQSTFTQKNKERTISRFAPSFTAFLNLIHK